VPPRWEAEGGAMPALFDLLAFELEARARSWGTGCL
jgi:hypothetical protein